MTAPLLRVGSTFSATVTALPSLFSGFSLFSSLPFNSVTFLLGCCHGNSGACVFPLADLRPPHTTAIVLLLLRSAPSSCLLSSIFFSLLYNGVMLPGFFFCR
jgi:hypothetical protein